MLWMAVQLVGALQKLDSNCLIDTAEGLETLYVYITNVYVKPQEKRYRKIRLSNVNYIERLGHLTGKQQQQTHFPVALLPAARWQSWQRLCLIVGLTFFQGRKNAWKQSVL